MKRRFGRMCVIGFCFLAGAAGAGEAAGEAPAPPAPALAAAFAPAPARRPYIGEWLEYRVCYPVDPLENAMGGAPIAPAAEEAPAVAPAAADAADAEAEAEAQPAPDPGAPVEYVYLPPASEPATAWRELPLRLEIVQVDDDACRAVMSFGNLRREVVLANRGEAGEGEGEFVFDSPPPADTARRLQLDGETFTCRLTRRHGEGYGFARLWSTDLPFGLARFATGDVDIILVGKGTGLPPAFPLRLKERIDPAPGLFHSTRGPAAPTPPS